MWGWTWCPKTPLPSPHPRFPPLYVHFPPIRISLPPTSNKMSHITILFFIAACSVHNFQHEYQTSVPTDDFIPKTRRCRNQHSMAFQTPTANTDVYKGSFFPQTIRDWNALPDSLVSSAEGAEDCVARFTSLVRARD